MYSWQDGTARSTRRRADLLLDYGGSSQLVHLLLEHDLIDELHLLLYPLMVGGGKRLLPDRVHARFGLKTVTPYPSGVVGLHYVRQVATQS